MLIKSDMLSQGNWCHEYGKIKTKVEALEKSQRHLMGEQLESLNLKELQQLEQQLESSLKHIRSRKCQLMSDSIAELQKKERSLQEQNKLLEKELMEKQKIKALTQSAQWEQQSQQQTSSSSPTSFLIGDSLPTLNIGTYQGSGNEDGEEAAQPQVRIGSSLLPSWMLSHLNG